MSILSNAEEEWLEDELIAKQMDNILGRLQEVYPSFDISEYKEKAKENKIPNPFKLEKSSKEELKSLAGLIHREYAMILVLGVVNAKITEDGRAVIDLGDSKEDITDSLQELIPHVATACSFAIQNLSINVAWEKEIDELLQILSLALYYAIALKATKLLEDILLIIVYASKNTQEPAKTKLIDKVREDLKSVGLEELETVFNNLAQSASG